MKKIETGGILHEVIQDGYVEKIINTMDSLEYNITCDKETDLFIQVQAASELKLNIKVLANAKCSILIWNESEQPIKLIEQYGVEHFGQLKVAYGDCGANEAYRDVKVDLVGDGASAIVKSSILAQSKKETTMICTSYKPHTFCQMENYSVVTSDGNYVLDATGVIKKGAVGSASHQTSRALTMSEKPRTTIVPQLLIDENDVEASHATSIGQVDENQMIYLQSRGLTEKQVVGLITRGYLLPIADFIEREELKDQLTKKIESKVEATCSM